jgi:predicted RND superfamily exporter protein
MKDFEVGFARWVLRNRWLVVLLTAAIVAAAGVGGKNIRFTSDYRVFFSDDNPQLLAFESVENTYAKNDNVMFVLAPSDALVFTNRTLEALAWITQQAWQTPYSTRVDSVTNFQHTQAQGDDLNVGDLVVDATNLSAEALSRIREVALAEPTLAGRIVARDASVSAVNVTVQFPGLDESVEVPQVVNFARALADEARIRYPEIDIRLPGMVMMNNAFAESSKLDLKTLVPMSVGAMVLFLVLALRDFTGTAVTVVVIIFSVITAMGSGGWIGFPLTPPSATAPTIILTMAIANCVHVLVTFLQHLRSGTGKQDALIESLRVNLQPVFLASLTTAIGFLCMNFSDVPPFRHLGTFVAMGVGMSFLLSVTFLPALMSLLPVRVGKKVTEQDRLMGRLADIIIEHRRISLWGMVALALVLILSVSRNELNDVFVEYFDESVVFRADSDFTTEHLTGLYVLEYSLESMEPGGIQDPTFLREMDAFTQWFRAQPETMHVNALSDTMKRLNRNMHRDAPDQYHLPKERNLAAQYLLLYEMSLPYGLDLNSQINIDKSATRMIVSIKTISSNETIALEARAAKWLAENAPSIIRADATGTTLMFAYIGRRNISSMLIGTTVALVLISTILMAAFRSVKMGLISLVPNLVPGAMGFGVWGLFVGEVGLALSVVTSMTLGIVVDDTVHFLSKYLRARRENGYSPPEAIRYAFMTVGRALVITSIVLVAGFLVLATSSFEINAGMGLLTAIVIMLALAADFFLLPPLLLTIEERTNADLSNTPPSVAGTSD